MHRENRQKGFLGALHKVILCRAEAVLLPVVCACGLRETVWQHRRCVRVQLDLMRCKSANQIRMLSQQLWLL